MKKFNKKKFVLILSSLVGIAFMSSSEVHASRTYREPTFAINYSENLWGSDTLAVTAMGANSPCLPGETLANCTVGGVPTDLSWRPSGAAPSGGPINLTTYVILTNISSVDQTVTYSRRSNNVVPIYFSARPAGLVPVPAANTFISMSSIAFTSLGATGACVATVNPSTPTSCNSSFVIPANTSAIILSSLTWGFSTPTRFEGNGLGSWEITYAEDATFTVVEDRGAIIGTKETRITRPLSYPGWERNKGYLSIQTPIAGANTF